MNSRSRDRSQIITDAIGDCWKAEDSVERVQGTFWTIVNEANRERDEPRYQRATDVLERQKAIRRDLTELLREVGQDND